MSIIQAIVVSAGIIVGFFIWKSQLIKKVRYEVSKKLLQSVIAVKAQLNKFRAPLVSSGESATALKSQGIDYTKDIQRTSNLASAAVFRERWQNVFEKYNEYELVKIEALATLDININDITKGFEECIRKIFTATNMFIQHYEFLANGQPGLLTPQMHTEMSQIVYAGFNLDGEGDKFEQKISKSIEEVRDGLKKFLSLK